MSARPVGPSTRPFQQQFSFHPGRQHQQHLYEPLLPTGLPFQNSEPPRLRERGLFSRCVCCVASVACIAGFLLFINFIVQYVSSETFGSSLGTSSSLPYVSKHTIRHQLRQKSLMKRFSMLTRSQNGNGVDLQRARQLFPNWFREGEVGDTGEPKLHQEIALSDLLLAMSLIVQAELEEETEHVQQVHSKEQ